MTDEKANELIAAIKELAAAFQNQNQKQPPNLFRKLEEFPDFDWENELPGCRIIARDKFGPTEVDYDGHVYRRYRSSEDDSKGIDIRYRCVLSGTVAEKNLRWGSLIKFGEPKKTKPLNTAVQEKIAERTAASQPKGAVSTPPTGSISVPVAPPPMPKTPSQPSFPDGNPPPLKDKPLSVEQDNLFLRWSKAADKWRSDNRGEIPFYYALEHGLTESEILLRLTNFEQAAFNTTEQLRDTAETKRAEAAARLKTLVDEAKKLGCELPGSYLQAWPSQSAENIEMTIGTVELLIKAHKNKYPAGKPQSTPTLPDINLQHGLINGKQELAFRNKYRAGANDRNHIFLALEQVAGGEAGRHAVIRWATDGAIESQKDLPDAWVIAFRDWLKPYKNGDGKWHVSPVAEKTIEQIIKETTPV